METVKNVATVAIKWGWDLYNSQGGNTSNTVTETEQNQRINETQRVVQGGTYKNISAPVLNLNNSSINLSAPGLNTRLERSPAEEPPRVVKEKTSKKRKMSRPRQRHSELAPSQNRNRPGSRSRESILKRLRRIEKFIEELMFSKHSESYSDTSSFKACSSKSESSESDQSLSVSRISSIQKRKRYQENARVLSYDGAQSIYSVALRKWSVSHAISGTASSIQLAQTMQEKDKVEFSMPQTQEANKTITTYTMFHWMRIH